MNVIKESFDNLPAAVCIFNDKGLVRLMNHRMLMVGAMFFGSGVQTLGELQAALKQPPAGVTADLAMPGVYHFPDGSILRFSERKITDRDGQRCTEVIASDVSALMEVRTELHRENERLDAANQKLRKLGEDLADIVREEEILRMKIRVHDDIGYSLLSVRRAFWQCDDLSALHALSEQWRTTIRLLHAEGREPPGDVLAHAKLRGKRTWCGGNVYRDHTRRAWSTGTVFSGHSGMYLQLPSSCGREQTLCGLLDRLRAGHTDHYE